MRILPILKLSWVKKFLPRGLFARSLIILVAPIVLIQITLAIVFFDNHWNRVTERLVYAVTGEIALYVDVLNNPDLDISKDNLKDLIYKDLEVYFSFKQGAKLSPKQKEFNWWEGIMIDALSEELDKRVKFPNRVFINIHKKTVLIQIAIDDGVVFVGAPLRRLYSSTAYIFLLWMAGLSIVLSIVAVLFMRNQIRPIKRLAVAADWFGKGRDVSFFKVSGSKEVRMAAEAFINMKERINKQVQQRTSMLAGVSHDLRTPLTRMKLQLEMMEENKDNAAMKSDLADMEKMVDAYLQFARGEGDEKTTDTDLNLLLNRCAQTISDEEFKVDVMASGDDIILPLRSFAFERCITNIIGNAKRFSSEVVISLKKQHDMIKIYIDDNGCGIPECERDEVFKPFYRGDKSRNSDSGSVGLGLSIAQDIVYSHGGDISLHESPNGGLRVTITLPT